MAEQPPVKSIRTTSTADSASTSFTQAEAPDCVDSRTLVAPIENIFDVKWKPVDSYKSIAIYKSKGVNPHLSRNLTKSISTVTRRVDSARASFNAVDRFINNPELDICRDFSERATLLDDWQNTKTDFEKILGDSREVALDGALMIEDFLSTIIPYLLVDGDMAKKREELSHYRKTVESGCKHADVFANDLSEVSNRVLEFRDKWELHTKETVGWLGSEVDKLRTDIAAATESIDETKFAFSSIIAQKRFEDGSRQQSTNARKRLLGFVKEARQASKNQKKTDEQVFRSTADIKKKADDLVVVWNFIHADLDVIEGQMMIAEDSKAHEALTERVDKLGVQYFYLKEALQMYSVAMASPDRARSSIGLWQKLFGQ